MSSILDAIVAHKLVEVEKRRSQQSISELESQLVRADPVRGFIDRLISDSRNVIAEIKRASPSKGIIRQDFDPTAVARSYERFGASCLSVLTDEKFFQGADEHMKVARQETQLPVLRKDFTLEPYQVIESRALGADCILLIVAILSPSQLNSLYDLAVALQMDVLVEVHDRDELNRALELRPRMIGINNRDLRTFDTSLNRTLELVNYIPEEIVVVSESGISTNSDVAMLRRAGVRGFLVGESLMRADDPGQQLKLLVTEQVGA